MTRASRLLTFVCGLALGACLAPSRAQDGARQTAPATPSIVELVQTVEALAVLSSDPLDKDARAIVAAHAARVKASR